MEPLVIVNPASGRGRAVKALPAVRARLRELGLDAEIRGWFTAVGNGISYGGGMRICPEANLHDGLLEVTVLGDAGKVEFLRAFPLVFKGHPPRPPEGDIVAGAAG